MKNQITLDIHLPGKDGIIGLNSSDEQEGFVGYRGSPTRQMGITGGFVKSGAGYFSTRAMSFQ